MVRGNPGVGGDKLCTRRTSARTGKGVSTHTPPIATTSGELPSTDAEEMVKNQWPVTPDSV
eukprot:2893350-Lingulodinium_polyedra.AAC.1